MLLELSKPLDDEVAWLNEMARAHLKNYQIWHHRQTVVDRRGSCEGEMDSLREILSLDDKNYHVWSYRQWLVRRFGLWDEDEVEDMDVMLADDVRNNSAWNHRWFVIFGNEERKPMDDAVIVEREIECVRRRACTEASLLTHAAARYAKSAIHRAPQNQSPWNYLRGLQRSARLPPTALKAFALEFASLDRPDDVTSSHALEVLADSYAAEGDTEKATKAFDLLIHRFDPVRARYWDWMKSSL